MKSFATRYTSGNNWVVPVSILSVVLGYMLASAWVTMKSRPSRLPLLNADQSSRVTSGPIDVQQESQQLSQEVAKLRLEKTKLENAVANQNSSTSTLNQNLQEAQLFAGLTPVEGPGLIVTLRDSKKPPTEYIQDYIIHDGDVLRVVNELNNAGAEAVDVNGNRVVGRTSVRCVGSTIMVNYRVIASPIIIRAVGDPKTLLGAMNLPGGVLDELKQIDPSMVQVDTAQSMILDAYTGSTSHRFTHLPTADK